jgi:hypothetical protein
MKSAMKIREQHLQPPSAAGDEWPDAVPQALAQLGAAEQLTPLLEFLQAGMGQMGHGCHMNFPWFWGSLYCQWIGFLGKILTGNHRYFPMFHMGLSG